MMKSQCDAVKSRRLVAAVREEDASRMRALPFLVTAVAVAAGCGGAGKPPPPPVVPIGHGLAVALPSGWHAAGTSLTPRLGDPREVLAVATYPLRYRDVGSCAHVPVSALADLGPRDAFVELEERGRGPASSWTGFPARPAQFGPRLGGPSEAVDCVPGARFTDHWFTFTDAGRHFHARVAFGPRAPESTRAQAWAVLDSLRVDAAVRPGWRAVG
jgi:hypothetical protein